MDQAIRLRETGHLLAFPWIIFMITRGVVGRDAAGEVGQVISDSGCGGPTRGG